MCSRLALLVDDWSCILHKIIDQHRPGSLDIKTQIKQKQKINLLVVISQVIIHSGGKIEEQIPGVLWD